MQPFTMEPHHATVRKEYAFKNLATTKQRIFICGGSYSVSFNPRTMRMAAFKKSDTYNSPKGETAIPIG